MLLYHGSPNKFEVLIPHQAYDSGFVAGCQKAVYATTNKTMAIGFALGAVADENGEVEREMMPEYGEKMVFKKGHPNYGGKGYLYVIESENFQHAMGSQWVCFEEVHPIEIIEINVDDYLEYCMIKENLL